MEYKALVYNYMDECEKERMKRQGAECCPSVPTTDTCSAVSTTGASEGGGPWFRGIPPPNRSSLSISSFLGRFVQYLRSLQMIQKHLTHTWDRAQCMWSLLEFETSFCAHGHFEVRCRTLRGFSGFPAVPPRESHDFISYRKCWANLYCSASGS